MADATGGVRLAGGPVATPASVGWPWRGKAVAGAYLVPGGYHATDKACWDDGRGYAWARFEVANAPTAGGPVLVVHVDDPAAAVALADGMGMVLASYVVGYTQGHATPFRTAAVLGLPLGTPPLSDARRASVAEEARWHPAGGEAPATPRVAYWDDLA